MIPLLFQYLTSLGMKVPSAIHYVSFRMIFAAMTTLLLTLVLGRVFIRILCQMKVGHTVRVADHAELGASYDKSTDVPSMGGILFILAITLSSFLWLDFSYMYTYLLLLTLFWMGAIGAFDDLLKLRKKKGISARRKFALQLLFAVGISTYLFTATEASSGIKPPVAKEKMEKVIKLNTKEYASRYYIPFFKHPIVLSGVGIVFAYLLSMIVIIGSTNAVNLTDGLDGLATGCVLFVALVLAIVAFLSNHITLAHYLNILYLEGSSEIAIFLCATMGACLGFLWYNGFPAQIFMGDTGSLALGGILGVASILLRREFLLALVGGVFVIETLSVIIQVLSFRYRDGKRVFLCAPLHHHFQMLGLHESKIVLRFWMVGLILALIGLASLKIQ